jgi:hypothetical protein
VEVAATATTLCSFTAVPNAQGKNVLTWALGGAPLPSTIIGFKVYRTATLEFTAPVEVASVSVAEAAAVDESGVALANTWRVTDTSSSQNAPAIYWLKTVGAGGESDMGQTSPQTPYQFVYMPRISR